LSQWFKSFVIETPLPYVCFLPRVFTLKNYPDFYCEFYCPKLPLVFTPVFLPSALSFFFILFIFFVCYLFRRLSFGLSVVVFFFFHLVFTLKYYADFLCLIYFTKLPLVFSPVFLPSELPCFFISPIFVMGYLVRRLAFGWSVADYIIYETL